jgi:glycosyltransferase involved in cell wall biosynthesis
MTAPLTGGSVPPDKRAMKIAYVINSLEGGGAALPVPQIVGALRQCGASLRIFALTRRDGRALAPMLAAGLDVTVREGGQKDHGAALRWLDRAMADDRPDLIWTSLTRATLLGQAVGVRRRVPVVSWQHAAFLRAANRRMLRATQRLTSLWVCDSESVSAFAVRTLGISTSRVITWPIFSGDPAAPVARAWQPGEPVRIASLGRLHRVKGYDVLIAALARISRDVPLFEVAIAGEGDEREALQAALDRAGLDNVRLIGFVKNSRTFLAGQHLYVQPSRSEGFCVAAHEAMQSGLPVVGSAVGEMARSIVTGTTGYLVPPGDEAALGAAIEACLARPEALHAVGLAARTRLFEGFSAERFQLAGEAIYRRLVLLCQAPPRPGPPASGRSV